MSFDIENFKIKNFISVKDFLKIEHISINYTDIDYNSMKKVINSNDEMVTIKNIYN